MYYILASKELDIFYIYIIEITLYMCVCVCISLQRTSVETASLKQK